MAKKHISLLLCIILFSQISFVINAAMSISLTSMEDKTEDTYEISSKILTLKSGDEFTIIGARSECGIVVDKGISPTIKRWINFWTKISNKIFLINNSNI